MYLWRAKTLQLNCSKGGVTRNWNIEHMLAELSDSNSICVENEQITFQVGAFFSLRNMDCPFPATDAGCSTEFHQQLSL